MIPKLTLSLLLIGSIANGAIAEDLPQFSSLACEADLCVLVTYADGSTDTIETTQENFNGKKVNVFKGKILSTGAKAVIIPKDTSGGNSEDIIAFTSVKAGGCTKFGVDLAKTERAECLNNAPQPGEGEEEDEDLGNFSEDGTMDRTIEEVELSPRALDPNGYKLKLAVYYDDSFAERFSKSPEDKIMALMALVDEMYGEKDTLKTEIDITVVAIKHLKGENWGKEKDWNSKNQSLKNSVIQKIWDYSASTDYSNGANLNVFMVGTNPYKLPNMGAFGVVCSPAKWNKWSLIASEGDDARIAEVIAHEIGHNLGFQHDCIGGCCSWWNPNVYKGPRVLDGKECYGYMDYNETTNYWSHCSVSDFKNYINRVPEFCLEKIVPDPPLEWGSGELYTLIELNTKSEAYQIAWALGRPGYDCVGDVDGPHSNPSYYGNHKQEEYRNNRRFTQWCNLPGYGEYQLRCINTEQQKRFPGNYLGASGHGWHGAYIEIDGQRYCEDFTEGDLQMVTVNFPEPPIPPGLENCPLPQRNWVDNGMCEDESNTADCQWDGGDCCDNESSNWDMYCDECECLGTPDFPTD